MILEDLLVPFGAVALAELGDKTQLSVLLLSSRTQKHLNLFLGVMLAFLLVDGTAILLGSWLHSVIPMQYLKLGAGAVFIVFGLLMLWKHKDEKAGDKFYSSNVFLSGFLLILLTELGDKTQLAAISMASETKMPFTVFGGAIAALSVITLIGVLLGSLLTRIIPQFYIRMGSGALFVIVGVMVLAGFFK